VLGITVQVSLITGSDSHFSRAALIILVCPLIANKALVVYAQMAFMDEFASIVTLGLYVMLKTDAMSLSAAISATATAYLTPEDENALSPTTVAPANAYRME